MLERREVLQGLGLLPAASAAAPGGAQVRAPTEPLAPNPSNRFVNQTVHRPNLVGTQVKAYAWLDEGIDRLLDNLQSKGNVNTVFAFTYLSDPTDIVTGKIPLPDHGTFGRNRPPSTGGANYDYDRKYFESTTLKEFRSPDDNHFNVVTAVAPKMHKRGMSFYAFDYNNTSARMMRFIPGFTEVSEVDVYGRRTDSACWNHPDYRNHLTGKIESLLAQYPGEVDAVVWGCERQGPLDNLIGGGWASVGISCFCPFCRAKAKDRGIDVERARAGYLALDGLFTRAQAKDRPADGFFVAFWRTLLDYPEILSWHMLWNDSYHEVRSNLYGTAKTLAPTKPFGFHIVQNVTFSPFYSAVEDYARIARYTDFLKLATYSNAGGGRMASYVKRLCSTIFADLTPDEFLPSYYKLMNYDEGSFAGIASRGLKPGDYIAKETKRALAGAGGGVRIYPSIDIDVPVQEGARHSTPELVTEEIEAALGAGAHGVLLAREYTEMWLRNLQAAGDATRRLFAQRG